MARHSSFFFAIAVIVLTLTEFTNSRTQKFTGSGRTMTGNEASSLPKLKVKAKQLAATDTSSQQVAKNSSLAKLHKANNFTSSSKKKEWANSASFVTKTVLTFTTVFLIGCAIILGVYAYRRCQDSSVR